MRIPSFSAPSPAPVDVAGASASESSTAPSIDASTALNAARVGFTGAIPLDDFLRDHGAQAVAQIRVVSDALSRIAHDAGVPGLGEALRRRLIDPLADLRAEGTGDRVGFQKAALETILRRMEGGTLTRERRWQVLKELEHQLRQPGIDSGLTLLKASRFALNGSELMKRFEAASDLVRQMQIVDFAHRDESASWGAKVDGQIDALCRRLGVDVLYGAPLLPDTDMSSEVVNRCFADLERGISLAHIADAMANRDLNRLSNGLGMILMNVDPDDGEQGAALSAMLEADALGGVLMENIECVDRDDARHVSGDRSSLAYTYWRELQRAEPGPINEPVTLWSGSDGDGDPVKIVRVGDCFAVCLCGPDETVRGIQEHDADQLESSPGFAQTAPRHRALVINALDRSVGRAVPSQHARAHRWKSHDSGDFSAP
ncbi:hypothetical protein Ddc_22039 [Ditylenchus destructor]|nr:hypothetical protein Ddc_22039 [Ditylenchus destructor]